MDQYVDDLAAFMNEYPPLWIVYGFLLVLPFVMMAFCCVKPRVKDDSARRKKTDEPSPDDKPRDGRSDKSSDILLPASSSSSITLGKSPNTHTASTSNAPHSSSTTAAAVTTLHSRPVVEPVQPQSDPSSDHHLQRKPLGGGGGVGNSGSDSVLGEKDTRQVKMGGQDVSKHTLVVSEQGRHSPLEMLEDGESGKVYVRRSADDDDSEVNNAVEPSETVRDEDVAEEKEEKDEENVVVEPEVETAQETGTVAGDVTEPPESKTLISSPQKSDEEGSTPVEQATSNPPGEMQASGSNSKDTIEQESLVPTISVEAAGQNEENSKVVITDGESNQPKAETTAEKKQPAEDVPTVGSGKTGSQFQLEDFDLMECEADPAIVEQQLEDPRLKELNLELEDGDSLGLSIVGGVNSPHGDLPIYIKKLTQDGVAGQQDKLQEGDQIVAVNDKLFVECTLDYAIQVLRNASGKVCILYLSEY